MSIYEINDEGIKIWRNNKRQLHREDGPALEYPDGTKEWYINGDLYREDGPAVEYASGSKYWYIKSKLHRLDGPAVELHDGQKYWYYHNKPIRCNSNEEFLKIIKMKAFW